jgi:hypothetical protein
MPAWLVPKTFFPNFSIHLVHDKSIGRKLVNEYYNHIHIAEKNSFAVFCILYTTLRM